MIKYLIFVSYKYIHFCFLAG